MARAVAKSIRLELTPAEQQRLASARPIEPGAWEAYLEGRHAWDQRTAAGFDEAIRHFRRSVELDPDSALGYTGLALAYDQQGVFGMIPPREAARLIREQLVRALELDDSLSEVHVAAGDLDFWRWDLEGAERSYRRALELNPSNTVAHRWLAYALVATGQAAEGVAALERAIQLDPRSSSMGSDAARLYVYVREYEKAEGFALRTLRIDPRHADAHSTLALLYSTLGRHAEAVEAGRRAVEVSGGGDWETGFLGYSLARAGEPEEARGLLEALIERSRQGYVDPIHMTRIHAGLRSGDEFFEWFERAYQTGSLWLSWVNISPVFDEVREDPRFREIARRVGLPQG